MADRRNEKLDLTPDAAAPPPGEPPDTVAIYGILGESGIASSVRLYLDRGLSTYYDIPIEGIAGREKVPADKSPLGVDSTLLFVRKGIRLVVHHVDTRTVEDEFLAGDFTAPGSFTPAPAGPGLPGPGLPGPGIPVSEICPTNIACTWAGCGGPPRTIATVCTQFGCPTRTPLCGLPSRGIACTIQGCNLTVARCPTEVCTIHPTIWTQIDCPGTIHPTLWTQIGCHPIFSAMNCPSLAGCPSIQCGGQGGPIGPVF